MKPFYLLDFAPTYTAAQNRLDGLADRTYLSSLLGSTGDGQPSSLITPSSIYQSSHGSTTSDPVSSSTPYQWHELYAAWRLAIVSPNLQQILVFPKKGGRCIRQTVCPSWTDTWSLNSPNIANTTYIYASEFLSVLKKGIRNRNCDSST